MSKIIEHPRIGNCKVLVEAEVADKHFVLVESLKSPHWDYMIGEKPVNWRRATTRTGLSSKRQYYVLWGNTPDFATMGITQLLTDKLNAVTGKTVVKRFFEIINASETISFKK
jgi:hypothetical protein